MTGATDRARENRRSAPCASARHRPSAPEIRADSCGGRGPVDREPQLLIDCAVGQGPHHLRPSCAARVLLFGDSAHTMTPDLEAGRLPGDRGRGHAHRAARSDRRRFKSLGPIRRTSPAPDPAVGGAGRDGWDSWGSCAVETRGDCATWCFGPCRACWSCVPARGSSGECRRSTADLPSVCRWWQPAIRGFPGRTVHAARRAIGAAQMNWSINPDKSPRNRPFALRAAT